MLLILLSFFTKNGSLNLFSKRRLPSGFRTTNLHRRETTVLVSWRHAHGRVHRRRWGSGTVGASGGAGVVLRAAPAETYPRVTNGVALHLVDGHFGGMTLDELDETTALARRDLDVGDFTEALEERTELVLSDVAGEATNENGGVVGVGELVHGLRSAIVVAHWGSTHGVHAHVGAAWTLGHAHSTGTAGTTTLVLGGSSADAHGAVTTVYALHLSEGLLLVLLAGESNETVSAGHATDGVGHDLGGFGGGVLVLEELNEDELGYFWTQVSDEDAEFGTTLIAATVAVSNRYGLGEVG